ncbi:DUF5664 domain-containing protein [Candidatus Binatia bacterium]|nr:DUF5664 domain-containing protein [Candidatus Binatia bacterium]
MAKRESGPGVVDTPSRSVATLQIGSKPVRALSVELDLGAAFGPDAPTHENAAGGRQSVSPCALDVVPLALLRVGRVLFSGETKNEDERQLVGRENWRKITSREHARHMLNHLILYLVGDRSDDHIEHAVARGLFIIERDQEPQRVLGWFADRLHGRSR